MYFYVRMEIYTSSAVVDTVTYFLMPLMAQTLNFLQRSKHVFGQQYTH
ncbi:hypothetical protein [Sphingobacterium sp.]|nr:hypothetical protein [Sphingobacterium sp.]